MIIPFPRKIPSEVEIFNFYVDPGHGWMHVPWTVFRDTGINPFQFSKYSYADELGVYLEEDVDLVVFEKRFAAKTGKRIVMHDIPDDVDMVRSKMSLPAFLLERSHRKENEQ